MARTYPFTRGHKSIVNTTITPLGPGETFTGEFEETLIYAIYALTLDTDQEGTLKIELSLDGETPKRTREIAINADKGFSTEHSQPVFGTHIRVTYENGTTAQGSFNLQLILHSFKSSLIPFGPNQGITRDTDAQLMRAVNEPDLDISRGLVADKRNVLIAGFNDNIPNMSFADIWSYGPTQACVEFPLTPEKFRVKAGGNLQDSASGTGARSLFIEYLRGDSAAFGETFCETIPLNGSSASVETTFVAVRLNDARVISSGVLSGLTSVDNNNVGDIIIEGSTSGLVLGQLRAEIGALRQAIYTIPLGSVGYLKTIYRSVIDGANQTIDLMAWAKFNSTDLSGPDFGTKRLIKEWKKTGGEHTDSFASVPIQGGTDIWLSACGNGNNIEADCSIELTVIKGDTLINPQ